MARITCRTPSTGKSLILTQSDVSDSFITLIEAPDFSIPDTSNKFTERDSADNTRAIRPGEIFFLTPMACKNKSTDSDLWLDTVLVTEGGDSIEFGRIEVPAGDTGFVPLQGRSIVKRSPAAAQNGDRIQIKAQVANKFDVWVSAEEKLASEHTGVE